MFPSTTCEDTSCYHVPIGTLTWTKPPSLFACFLQVWERIPKVPDITRHQVSKFSTFTSLQKYSTVTSTPLHKDSRIFSIVLKVSSSWTDYDKLVPSIQLYTEIVMKLKKWVKHFFVFPISFWCSRSGIYFKCETSLLSAVFYCWNCSQLIWRIQSEALCFCSDFFFFELLQYKYGICHPQAVPAKIVVIFRASVICIQGSW